MVWPKMSKSIGGKIAIFRWLASMGMVKRNEQNIEYLLIQSGELWLCLPNRNWIWLETQTNRQRDKHGAK